MEDEKIRIGKVTQTGKIHYSSPFVVAWIASLALVGVAEYILAPT